MRTHYIRRHPLKKYSITFSLLVLIAAAGILFNSGCKKARTVEQLVDAESLVEAIERVEELKGEAKIKGYRKIAGYYFKIDEYKTAADFYIKAGAHERAVNCFYLGDMITQAEDYTSKLKGTDKQKCAAHLAKRFYAKGDYNRALKYYRLGGDAAKVTYIETKIPIFKLAEAVDEARKKVRDFNNNTRMRGFSHTIKEYIYIDKYRKWNHGENTEPDYRAAAICKKAFDMIEKDAAPLFFDKVRVLLTKDEWTKKTLEPLEYHHTKLVSLIELIEKIHQIAEFRPFFTRHSNPYREPTKNGETPKIKSTPEKTKKTFPDPGKALNYEQVYLRALNYADSLFDTIEDAKDVTKLDWLKDYRDDLSVDTRNIEYIYSMLQNLQTRLSNIIRFSKQLKKSTETDAIKNKAERLSRDFLSKSNLILYYISTGKYNEANTLLTTSYESFRQQLAVRKKKKK